MTTIHLVSQGGFFPIMHTVVVRRGLGEAHPWLPRELLIALQASRRIAVEAAIRWSHEQGMISRQFPPDELFAASTVTEPPNYV